MNKILLPVMMLVLLSGCASFVSGRKQEIKVDTQNVKGAKCYVMNDKDSWYLERTPGKVKVDLSEGDIAVSCMKDGYKNSRKKFESSTRGWWFGNVLLMPLAPVGAFVDWSNGAAFEYPKNISMTMEPRSYESEDPEIDFDVDLDDYRGYY